MKLTALIDFVAGPKKFVKAGESVEIESEETCKMLIASKRAENPAAPKTTPAEAKDAKAGADKAAADAADAKRVADEKAAALAKP